MKSPFNSYDERGLRQTKTGSASTKMADEALLYNLRFRWPEELKKYSDAACINGYDEFAVSELWGNNDEHFLEWMESYDA